ncbi:MAG: filamentous hemagglutinin N-terminal domain-containing protein, partial [Gammaproteobacteria bacterium]|nr:filamentous hemagglutinin N-terminal domain-containing protein [Gammaproteobacteria bacterium]
MKRKKHALKASRRNRQSSQKGHAPSRPTSRAYEMPTLHRSRIALCIASMSLSATVSAAPIGAEVVHGNAAFVQQGNHLQISNSHGTIINWQDFSIATQESVNFLQTHASSAILNRVISNIPSDILGELTSNGRVFVINPNGLIIGQDARIDTAGFVASTLDMSDKNFLAGTMKFVGDSGEIENHGYIAAGPGGEVILIAPNIENHGIIEAEDGSIMLAAGREVTLHSMQQGGLSYKVSAPSDSVLNIGQLVANNGSVKVFADQIFQQGAISATRARRDADGNVVLEADTNLNVSGEIDVRGHGVVGGTAHLLGERIEVSNANIDASGEGGGEVLIGGDYQGDGEVRNAQNTNTDEATIIRADGGTNGAGGRVIVWSDNTTNSYAKITARGGSQSGDGGFVETSGKKVLDFGQPADVSATNGAAGTWLLDPEDIVIDEEHADSISTSLNGGSNVEVRTSDEGDGEGNITVEAPITKTEGEAAVSLTLDAHNRVDVNAPITTTAGPLNLTIKTGREVVAVDPTEAQPDVAEEEAAASDDTTESTETTEAVESQDSEAVAEAGTEENTDTGTEPNTDETVAESDTVTDEAASAGESEEQVADASTEPEASETEGVATDTEVLAESDASTIDEVPAEEVSTDELSTDEVAADAIQIDDTAADDLAVEEVAAEEVVVEAVTVEEVATDEVVVDEADTSGNDIADAETTADESATDQADSETVTAETSSSEADGFIEQAEQQIVIAADI